MELDCIRPTAKHGFFLCTVCRKEVSCAHQGRRDVTRHVQGSCHVKNKDEQDRALAGASTLDTLLERKDNLSFNQQVELYYVHIPINVIHGYNTFPKEMRWQT